MYLEGSDQHRGWFHSSLIESSGTRGVAPFDVVLTHGFVLDEHGHKMSKSLGNTVAPQDVIKSSGADILRMWVCASDYADDLRIGPEILKTTVETYRKLRNTIRWLLGNLVHFHPGDAVAYEEMPGLEKYLLHRLAELDALVRASYAEFDYKRIFAGAQPVHDRRPLGVLFRHPQGHALLRSDLVAQAQGLPHRARPRVSRHRDLARADALLHRGGGLGCALSGGGLGPSRAVPRDPADLARRCARQGVGRYPQGPPGGDRRARDRTRQQADRVEPRGGAGGAHRRPRVCCGSSPASSRGITGRSGSPRWRSPPSSRSFREWGRKTRSGSRTCRGSRSNSAPPSARNARGRGRSCRPSAATRNIPDVTPRDAEALREWDAVHAKA